MKHSFAALLFFVAAQIAAGRLSSSGPLYHVSVGTSPAGRTFSVDGTSYSATQEFTWLIGTNHLIAVGTPQGENAGTRYAFTSWSDWGELAHFVNAASDTTFTARFTPEYFLTMKADTGGTVTPQSGWRRSGEELAINATAKSGYSFVRWSGSGRYAYNGSSTGATIYMYSPVTEEAIFGPSVQVRLLSNPSGLFLTADGDGWSSTFITPASFSCARGSLHRLSAITPQSPYTGAQYIFRSWSDHGAASHTIVANGDTDFTANFGTQYLLSMSAGEGGWIDSPGGWHDSGQTVQIRAIADIVHIFKDWTGTGAGSYTGPDNPASVTMNGPISERAEFRGAPTISFLGWEAADFGDVLVRSCSASQAYRIGGRDLVGGITVSAARGTEFSADNVVFGDTVLFEPPNGIDLDTTLYVRICPPEEGPVVDTITFTSPQATRQTARVTGAGIRSYAASTLWIRVSDDFSQQDFAVRYFTNLIGGTYGRDSASRDYREYEGPPPPPSGLNVTWNPFRASGGEFGGYPMDIHGIPTNALVQDTFQFVISYVGHDADSANFFIIWPNSLAIGERCANLFLVPVTLGLIDGAGHPVSDRINMRRTTSLVLLQPIQATGTSSLKFNIYKYGVTTPDPVNDMTSVEPPRGALPSTFALLQNFPNPFNPSTTIRYSVPKESYIRLVIYDLLGRHITTLVDERKEAGEYSVDWQTQNAPSGIYFCRMNAGGLVLTNKMTVMK